MSRYFEDAVKHRALPLNLYDCICGRGSLPQHMCNRVVQKGKVIKPGERVVVLLKGPGAEFSLPFEGGVFAGPARSESRNYWIKSEGAVEVLVPDVSRFGEKNKATGEQGWEDLPPGSALEGLLLPPAKELPNQPAQELDLFAADESPAASQPRLRDYRLLKIVTQPATPDQLARLGNDRAPVVRRRAEEREFK